MKSGTDGAFQLNMRWILRTSLNNSENYSLCNNPLLILFYIKYSSKCTNLYFYTYISCDTYAHILYMLISYLFVLLSMFLTLWMGEAVTNGGLIKYFCLHLSRGRSSGCNHIVAMHFITAVVVLVFVKGTFSLFHQYSLALHPTMPPLDPLGSLGRTLL